MVRETTRNNISVEFNNNSLVITNKVISGKTSITDYQASANSQILLDVVRNDQVDSLYDPIL